MEHERKKKVKDASWVLAYTTSRAEFHFNRMEMTGKICYGRETKAQSFKC